VQGLVDAFQKMHFSFESAGAKQSNIDIFETRYFGAGTKSCKQVEIHGYLQDYLLPDASLTFLGGIRIHYLPRLCPGWERALKHIGKPRERRKKKPVLFSLFSKSKLGLGKST